MQLNIHSFTTVADAIVWANTTIDQTAGAARARYITVASGQDATYVAKYQDAIAFTAANFLPADATGFPWVQQEATATNTSPQTTATNIVTSGNDWNNIIGPKIEGLRVGGKAAIASLTDIQLVIGSAYATTTLLNAV